MAGTRRHAVVADEPERNGSKQEAEAPLDRRGQDLMPGRVLDREVPFRVRRLERLIFRRQLRLLDRQEQNADGDEHDGRHDHKQRLIVHAPARGLDGLEPRL